MLGIQRACRRHVFPILSRRNATLQTSAEGSSQIPPSLLSTTSSATVPPENARSSTDLPTKSDEPSESSSAPKPRSKAIVPRRRPNISLENPRKWNPPVKKGLLPAYDEAMKLIEHDSKTLKKEATELRKRLEALSGGASGENVQDREAEVESIRKKLSILDIQAYINLPSVRWKAANGMADMTKPVYRQLVEQKWRTRGDLDLLMERIHQMNVIPDLLPTFHPSLDLRITFPEPPPQSTYLRTRVKRRHTAVEPGSYLLPEQTRRAPRLYTSVFHTETRLYTLAMIDPDVPDPENSSFTTYLHWLAPNIPLSATSKSPLVLAPPLTYYVPPHPQKGSPYHRYCLFLLPQPDAAQSMKIPVIKDDARRGFNLRKFCENHGYDVSAGGGAHMWREVWNDTVSDIYTDTLKLPEPVFAYPPVQDRYGEVKKQSKYSK
ncbi:PEBP-like protein [Schizopora paradoxa]|uniref:PEBP-like protein n=1 Tax=Schizopora paradoxa TaxID=27342 RepID=A0A0H2SA12_9AGAM|nr:PEBP-like protein [Schizopora paradoxa]